MNDVDMSASRTDRSRTSHVSTMTRAEAVSNFLFDFNAATAPKKVRMEAINFASELFYHRDAGAHDEELALGAVNVLIAKLSYAYCVCPLDEEMAMTSVVLEMILGGASRTAVAKAFDEAGRSVIPLLVDIIQPPSEHCHPVAVDRILSILRCFSRVPTAMVPIAHHPGMIDAVIFHLKGPLPVISHLKEPTPSSSDNTIASEVEERAYRRIDAAAIIVNLACAEENKLMLANHQGLLEEINHMASTDPDAQAREHAATVIMNLAYNEQTKIEMANNEALLDTLVLLMGDVSPQTRKNASAALFTLACVASNTKNLALHRGGSIVESLRIIMLQDTLDEARDNAAEALFNLARNSSTDDSSIQDLSNHNLLLDSLAEVVSRDSSPYVKNFAAKALECFSISIQHPAEAHRTLLAALVKASIWTGSSSIAQSMRNQADFVSNRIWMVQFPGMLDALSQMALLSDHEFEHVRMPAVAAIERLTLEPSTRWLMAKHEGIMTSLTLASFVNSAGETTYWDQRQTIDKMASVDLYKAALKNLTDAANLDPSSRTALNISRSSTDQDFDLDSYTNAASSEVPMYTSNKVGSEATSALSPAHQELDHRSPGHATIGVDSKANAPTWTSEGQDWKTMSANPINRF